MQNVEVKIHETSWDSHTNIEYIYIIYDSKLSYMNNIYVLYKQ